MTNPEAAIIGSPHYSPVVYIKTANGPVRIDRRDYNATLHTLYNPDGAAPGAGVAPKEPNGLPVAPVAPGAVLYVCELQPGNWYITDAVGKALRATTYPTKEAASAAIAAGAIDP